MKLTLEKRRLVKVDAGSSQLFESRPGSISGFTFIPMKRFKKRREKSKQARISRRINRKS